MQRNISKTQREPGFKLQLNTQQSSNSVQAQNNIIILLLVYIIVQAKHTSQILEDELWNQREKLEKDGGNRSKKIESAWWTVQQANKLKIRSSE